MLEGAFINLQRRSLKIKLSLRAVARQSSNEAEKYILNKPATAKKAHVTTKAQEQPDCRAIARSDRFGQVLRQN